ncbi:DUF4233 domain-containing protein [Nocardioides marmoribigeumensis]|uniref:Apolipoprotein N-acyltransferase n=1 Tax=Nocardioides marmoribigeumensis TaxID=433649 RepID=A0ABU2C0N7_9ACTN|nr:DUF4233 domain-containing protein [Nocardioides marmoribigeumensis]MDR7364225.1 apolipoprotein N-acyltransferase [Nocardioides marmoribigeumensis]
MTHLQRTMCAGILLLQTIALVPFAAVLLPLTDLSTPAAVALGVGLPLASLVAAGALRTRAGVWLGWSVEVGTIATGVVVPLMFGLGAVFLALFAGSWFLGRRIDRERAERTAAWEAEQEPEQKSEQESERAAGPVPEPGH